MKLLCSLLLALCALPAGAALWYAGAAAAGSANGTSWANQWLYTSINWGSVAPGDTVSLDGGSTSQSYSTALSIADSGSSGNTITIRVGQDASHNGTVIFEGVGINMESRSYIVVDGQGSDGSSKWFVRNYYNECNGDAATVFNLQSTTGCTVRWITASNINNFALANYSGSFAIHNNTILAAGGTYGFRCLQLPATSFDVNTIYSNYIHLIMNTATPGCSPGGYPYFGPDGIQSGNGLSFWANTVFTEQISWRYTSGEHPDVWQNNGGANWQKIYRNEFINSADSILGFGAFQPGGTEFHDIWIYNNVFRIQSYIDPYPDYIRTYHSEPGVGSVSAYNNFRIMNNTFLDQRAPLSQAGWPTVLWSSGTSSSTGSGNYFCNNLFKYVGQSAGSTTVGIAGSSTWTVSGNLFDESPGLVSIPGFAGNGAQAQTNLNFVRYDGAGDVDNDVHLSSGSPARDVGTNLTAMFTTDKDGLTRVSSGMWDAGAYLYTTNSGGGSPGSPILQVTAVSQDFGFSLTNVANDLSVEVKNVGADGLNGTVSIASPFAVASGTPFGPLNSNATASVVIRYNPTSEGDHAQSATFDTTNNDVVVAFIGMAYDVVSTGSAWSATNTAAFRSPWLKTNDYIWQTSETTLAAGGWSIYGFQVPTNGEWRLDLSCDALDDSRNSAFIFTNSAPLDPSHICDITNFTSGFATRAVNQRGAGEFNDPEFEPWVITLQTNTVYALVLRGRERYFAIRTITPVLQSAAGGGGAPPSGLVINVGAISRQAGSPP